MDNFFLCLWPFLIFSHIGDFYSISIQILIASHWWYFFSNRGGFQLVQLVHFHQLNFTRALRLISIENPNTLIKANLTYFLKTSTLHQQFIKIAQYYYYVFMAKLSKALHLNILFFKRPGSNPARVLHLFSTFPKTFRANCDFQRKKGN